MSESELCRDRAQMVSLLVLGFCMSPGIAFQKCVEKQAWEGLQAYKIPHDLHRQMYREIGTDCAADSKAGHMLCVTQSWTATVPGSFPSRLGH